MPNVGSWNGKWTGAENLYCRIRGLSKAKAEELEGKSFYYRWNDGWGASVECRKVSGNEITEMRNKSNGFCGYDWMIESIIQRGAITDD